MLVHDRGVSARALIRIVRSQLLLRCSLLRLLRLRCWLCLLQLWRRDEQAAQAICICRGDPVCTPYMRAGQAGSADSKPTADSSQHGSHLSSLQLTTLHLSYGVRFGLIPGDRSSADLLDSVRGRGMRWCRS